jgi:hypothetical protein
VLGRELRVRDAAHVRDVEAGEPRRGEESPQEIAGGVKTAPKTASKADDALSQMKYSAMRDGHAAALRREREELQQRRLT